MTKREYHRNFMRRWRAAKREEARTYMRLYMRRWRADNIEIARANVRDSYARRKAK